MFLSIPAQDLALKSVPSALYEFGDAHSNEDRLGEDLLKRLKDMKYLIVLDDIWSIEAWNSFEGTFPRNRNGSKVIFTSRFAAIGKELCRDINTHNVSDITEKILAGFDTDQKMEVISVVGLPGIGKTTLLQKVFEHRRTRSNFQVRAWVTVSQTYSSRRLLIDILQSSSLYEFGDAHSTEDRLGKNLRKRLNDKKYLIVLDDLWSIEAWNSIERTFPPNRNGSKVIFTSRFAVIGRELCSDINTHNVSGLSVEHSWNLLKYKVFGSGDQRSCTPELERFGREIAKKCNGLPMDIIVIGGLLAKNAKIPELWRQVARNVDQYIAVGEVEKALSRMRCDESLEAEVGIDEPVEKILAGFDTDQPMEVISVVGLPGIGKTTLADKVFYHSRTKSSFEVRAWVTVSQIYCSKRLLIDILHSSSLYKDGDVNSNEDRLGEDLLKRLKGKKYLIVLDDIWSIAAWNSIQRSFPPNDNGCKVIFTSRFAAIGKDLCRDINTHNISGLSEEHSWNLLKYKVFGSGDCPPELERFGREIAKKCDGLPLAIVVIGGLLAKKAQTPEQWRQVATSLTPAIASNREAYMDTLALSYQHLPVHLKACFLFLGSIFPEDYEIPIRRLVWLLVAEGFVIEENDGQQIQNSDVIVEGYLNDLVERSLVTVSRKRLCGATKTFRIHDLLRDFCLVRGKQEKFIHKLKGVDGFSSSLESALKEQRRLLVKFEFSFPDRQFSSNIRSLIFDGFTLSCDNKAASLFADSFRLLKVFELRDGNGELLNKLQNMARLRYLAVLSPSHMNPAFASSVTKLLYLETLFIDLKKATDMPDDIWNMVKLRHLYNKGGIFHFKASRSQGAKRLSVLPDLQTLHTLCACRSCLNKLVRTPYLKKLGLLGSLISVSGCSTIPDLGFLDQLLTLKITNSSFYSHRSSVLVKLKLPASLRKLTLENTLLKWEEISVLAELENLEVLKLLDNACVEADANSDWDTSDVDFPKIKYLKLRRLDIVKWDDQNLQCESLEVLVLEECRRLESIPFDLALSSSLHTMEVTRCDTLVEKLAKEIEAEHETQSGDTNLRVFIKS